MEQFCEIKCIWEQTLFLCFVNPVLEFKISTNQVSHLYFIGKTWKHNNYLLWVHCWEKYLGITFSTVFCQPSLCCTEQETYISHNCINLISVFSFGVTLRMIVLCLAMVSQWGVVIKTQGRVPGDLGNLISPVPQTCLYTWGKLFTFHMHIKGFKLLRLIWTT